MILAGIDEAGYGPTLGPLVVSVAVFRVPGFDACFDREGSAGPLPDLWHALEDAVARKRDGRRCPVNDSKKLFQQRKGLRDLEEGLLPFVALRTPQLPRTLRALLAIVARPEHGAASGYLDAYPWYEGRDLDLPRDTFRGVLVKRRDRLKIALDAAGIEHLGVAVAPIEVDQFNRMLRVTDNKAAVSFEAIGAFLRRLWRSFPKERIDVTIDRQGGRMRYAADLFGRVRPRSIRIEQQSVESSTYRLARRGDPEDLASMRVRFTKESEEQSLPVALASMASKYVRELHMDLFNAFWKRQRADLKPTAGYTVDARRFLRDIAPLRQQLAIGDQMLVRRR